MRPLILLSFFALSACTYSTANSYVDRSQPIKPVTHMLVVASNLPLADRQRAETAIANELLAYGVRATVGIEVIPPFEKMDNAEINSRIASTGADSILILYETGRDIKEQYVPPQVVGNFHSSTTGTMRGFGNMYTYQSNTITTPPSVIGGYSVEKPRATYGGAIYDLRENGRQIWQAEISTRGSALASFADLADKAADEVIKLLQKDGVIYPTY